MGLMKHFSTVGRVLCPRYFWSGSWLIRTVRVGLLSFLVVMVIVFSSPSASAQLPSFPSPLSQPPSNQPPADVQRLGDIEVAPVEFDGQTLFNVASPTVLDRSHPGNLIPVEIRAQEIEENLNRVIGGGNIQISLKGIKSSTPYDSRTLQVYIGKLNRATTILVKDKTHPLPLQILTVTEADAEAWGQPIDLVAEAMRQQIDRELNRALMERSTFRVDVQAYKALLIAAGVIVTSAALWLMRRVVVLRYRAAKKRQTAELAAVDEDDPEGKRLAALSQLQQQSDIDSYRRRVVFLKWLVFWLQVLVWGIGLYLILSLFPWTRTLSWDLLSLPVKLLAIFFIAGLSGRLGDLLLTVVEDFATRYQLLTTEDEQRGSLRIATSLNVLKGMKVVLVYAIALVTALWIFGAPISSILTASGLLIIALSFSFQNLGRDLANGCLILWEDQFAIGDYVAVQNTVGKIATGLVENMNLRLTQLRSDEGRLISIPNSTIIQVENLTRSWSRVDFVVKVAYEADLNRAIALIQEVAQKMYQEPEWQPQILETPEVLGVDDLSHEGMLIRVWIKTQPAQQWVVSREFRRRVRLALEQNGVAIGKPHLDLAGTLTDTQPGTKVTTD